MNRQRGFTAYHIVVAIVALAGIYGWVANIVKIVHSDFTPITGLLVVRCVGIFVPPLGVVMGYL